MKEKIKHIPVRFIAIKAKVDNRTVTKFLNKGKVIYSKELAIKSAIKEILETEKLLDE